MARLDISLDDSQFVTAFTRFKAHFDDFSPLLEELGIQVYGFWAKKFRAQGPGWAPLAESTLARRRQQGKGAQILRDEGRLFNSLVAKFGEGAVYKVSPVSLEMGTNLEYASVHDSGSPSRHIPRRPILPNDREIDPIVKRVVERFVKEAELGK